LDIFKSLGWKAFASPNLVPRCEVRSYITKARLDRCRSPGILAREVQHGSVRRAPRPPTGAEVLSPLATFAAPPFGAVAPARAARVRKWLVLLKNTAYPRSKPKCTVLVARRGRPTISAIARRAAGTLSWAGGRRDNGPEMTSPARLLRSIEGLKKAPESDAAGGTGHSFRA